MILTYHSKSKFMNDIKEVNVIREHYIGKTLFGYVVDVGGKEMLLSKRFPDTGRTWRYKKKES